MKRRTKIILLSVLGLIILVPAVLILLAVIFLGSKDTGSPELAAEWRARLESYESLREAKEAERLLVVVEFDDGEWAMALAQNSHGGLRNGGGTVVVRDSRGQVRAFSGHVCGHGELGPALWDAETLEEFYEALAGVDFIERPDW